MKQANPPSKLNQQRGKNKKKNTLQFDPSTIDIPPCFPASISIENVLHVAKHTPESLLSLQRSRRKEKKAINEPPGKKKSPNSSCLFFPPHHSLPPKLLPFRYLPVQRLLPSHLVDGALERGADDALGEGSNVVVSGCNLEQPLGLDVRHRANVVLCRQHKLVVDQPLVVLLEHCRRVDEHVLYIPFRQPCTPQREERKKEKQEEKNIPDDP